MDLYPNLFILPECESIKVCWGGYSIVEAELKLIKRISSEIPIFHKIIFLSGEDFPIKPIADFEVFLSTKENFISLQRIRPDSSLGPEFIENLRFSRVSLIHNFDLTFFKSYKKETFFSNKLCRAPHKILHRLKIPNCRIKDSNDYYVGSQWIAISKTFAHLLVQNERQLKKEFGYSFAPDELAFQTLYGRIMKSIPNNGEAFDAVIDAEYHVVPPGFTVGGNEWSLEHLNIMRNSTKFFVRKPNQELINELQKLV